MYRQANTSAKMPINKHLWVLLGCVFVVMIGFGITLPVLPFYVERLALEGGASREAIVLHVTLLTGVYALMQLLFAPVWGSWSDRVGRRPPILIGIAGYIVAQILFGLATSLWLLYLARIFGGILSSATLPVAGAYVADLTSEAERSRGMAWFGTAVSLGFVVGPALGGTLSQSDLHLNVKFGHLLINSFSVPFFAAALIGLITLFVCMRWLQESLPTTGAGRRVKPSRSSWRPLVRTLAPFLGLALAAQFGLATFEAIFALYAQVKFSYGPGQVGLVFVVCGLVMTVFQLGVVGLLAGHIRELRQIGVGFALMGTSMALLVVPSRRFSVLLLVGLLASGTALVSPNLAALISKRSGTGGTGAALGAQNAANSFGQVTGPILGGALFLWQTNAPYVLTGVMLIAVSALIAYSVLARKQAAVFAP